MAAYSTSTIAEEFGGTSVGAAYQVLKKLLDDGLVDRPREGQWRLTTKGREAAEELEAS
jgi:Mn-dependent DtxR family transcriptional regulator